MRPQALPAADHVQARRRALANWKIRLRRIATALLEEFEKMRRSAFPGVDYLALADPRHQARSVFVEVANPSACFDNPNP